jgi:alkyl hydroperoxide reductase 1
MLTPQTEFADKKVVLFAVPGAFTPSCSVKHLPGYIENVATLKSKGVDIIAVIAYNDAYVMSAWGKANGIKDDSIVRLAFPVPDFQSPPPFTSPNPRHP